MTASAAVAPAVGRRDRAALPSREQGWSRRRSHGLMNRVFVQVLLCCLPAALLIAAGSARLAGIAFWGTLAALGLRLVVARRADELLCLVLAVAPFVNFLRGFVFYNVVYALFAAALLLRFRRSPAGLRTLLARYPLVPWLGAFLVAYWLLSFVLTGRYDVNSRVLEMLAALAAVLVVARRPALVAASLRGLIVSTCAMGLGILPHLARAESDRLGIVVLEGRTLGNPIQLGLPLALGVLALVADRGRWLGLSRRPLVRVLVLVPVVGLLALTTSRASWLVAVAGVLCVFLFGRRSRASLLAGVVVGVVVLQMIRLSPAGGALDAALDRTFGAGRSARNRTSGRSDQWLVAWHAVTETAGSMLWGYGPGSGGRVYAQKSSEIASVEFEVGREMSLHSLYMQVAVETGLVGLVPLGLWFGVSAVRVASGTRRLGLVLPAACFLSFVLIAATVSGADTVSGMFLGLGLLATARGPDPHHPSGGRAGAGGAPRRPVTS